MAQSTQYNLAMFVFGKKVVKMDSFKTTRKQDVEKHTSCDSHIPYGISITEESFEWEASDIKPSYRKFFSDLMDRQKQNYNKLPTIATYDYDDVTGNLIEDDIFRKVWIEEISKDTANKPFSVKGGALMKMNPNM